MDNLTPDFLIANEFEYDSDNDTYTLETDFYYIEIEFFKDRIIIYIKTYYFNTKFNNLNISLHNDLSVDKFQQILEIMDIDLNFRIRQINKDLLLKNKFIENLTPLGIWYEKENQDWTISIRFEDEKYICIACTADNYLEGVMKANSTIQELENLLQISGINFKFEL